MIINPDVDILKSVVGSQGIDAKKHHYPNQNDNQPEKSFQGKESGIPVNKLLGFFFHGNSKVTTLPIMNQLIQIPKFNRYLYHDYPKITAHLTRNVNVGLINIWF